MANIRKKVINQWDGGILTSKRDNNPDTSYGAQMIKGFDVYKDPKKLIPMQDWTDFTTVSEREYNIMAMGGQSDTVYGLGSAIDNWIGRGWSYRVPVTFNSYYTRSGTFPFHVDLSLMPSGFWDNVQDDLADVRVTSSDGATGLYYDLENIDYANETGDLWVSGISGTAVTENIVDSELPAVNINFNLVNSGTAYAFAFPVSFFNQSINYIKFKCSKVGTPSNLKVAIYTDSAGSPGTLVQNLGEIDTLQVTTAATSTVVSLPFDELTLNGSYWVVYTVDTADGSNYYNISFLSTGTTIVKKADIGLSWTGEDATATPYYEIGYWTGGNNITIYVYYGNSTVGAPAYGVSGFDYYLGGRRTFGDFKWFYTFSDDKANNKSYSDGATGETEAFTTDPTYLPGLFGNGISTYGATIQTDTDDDVGLSANRISFSFLMYVSAAPASNKTIYTDSNGDWSIVVTTGLKIEFTANGSAGSTPSTSALSVPTGQWVVVDCVFDSNSYIYIDNVLETFAIGDGNYDGSATNEAVVVSTGNVIILGQLIGYNGAYTANAVFTKYHNFTNSNFLSVGAQEGTVDFTYSGVQLYQKTISSGDWSEKIEQGYPVKSLVVQPTNSFIDDTGSYFVVSQTPDYGGFLYLASSDGLNVIEPNHLLLSTLVQGLKTTPQMESASDGTSYFTYASANIGSVGDPGSASEFTAASSAQNITAWRDYLAIGYTRRNRGFIDIWDLAASNYTERIDVGTGNVRIVGNASDTLFSVVDNFVDDEVKSANNPTVEIRQYVGNGTSEATHVLEIPTNITSYDDFWERAVSNFKLRRNTQTLFYMRLPQDSTGTTFDEGFWAVGKNSQGKLCLTLQIDTAGLGMPENVFGFAQQVFFLQKDGNIKRLSEESYTNISLFKTLKMNEGNTEIEKKLHGVELITEPLEAGQTVSLYFTTDSVARTKIFDMTGTGEITREATFDIDGLNLPHYKEIEFDVESTGGKAATLEVNYKFEYLSDVV